MSQHLNSNISTGQQVLYCGMIAISAILILAPAVRLLPYAKLVVFIMMVVFLFTIVRRGMRSGNIKLTLPQIYLQAKAGRKFTQALETAAVVAVNIAFWMTI
jgi:hypothetical protein